jgi:hypothetical protein
MIAFILTERPTDRCFGSKNKRRQGSTCSPQSHFLFRGLNRMLENAKCIPQDMDSNVAD